MIGSALEHGIDKFLEDAGEPERWDREGLRNQLTMQFLVTVEDLIAEEEVVVTISHSGYIKRNAVNLYRAQRRGGKGKIAMGIKEEDFVETLFTASTHDSLLFFTDAGKVYWLKVHEIPEAGRAAKGKALVNLLALS